MEFIRFPAELQLLIAEKLESRELSYLYCANHYLHSLCTPVLERLAQEPRKWVCALEWAIMNNHPPLVQLLLSKGHDINNLEGHFRSGTALHVAVSWRKYPLILLFLENPALDLSKLDSNGDAALHLAIQWGNLEVVKLLHAAGADLKIADKDGRTTLLYAYYNGHKEIIEFLVRTGANVNARAPAGAELSVTLLQNLVRYDSEKLVRLALEYGVDLEVRDDKCQMFIEILFQWGLTDLEDIWREVSLPLDMNVESNLDTV